MVDYEKYWEEGKYQPGSLGPEFWRSIKSELPKSRFRLLDYGCGNGAAAGDLGGYDCEYVGADVSTSAVNKARTRGLACEVIDQSGTLPFQYEEFDVVLSSCVVEHITDAAAAYELVVPYLKRGGLFIIRTDNIMHWRRRLDYLLLGRWNPGGDELSIEKPWRDPHVRFFTGDSLLRFAREIGLQDCRLTGDSGRLAQWVPIAGRLWPSRYPSRFSRRLSRLRPSFFSSYMTVIGKRP